MDREKLFKKIDSSIGELDRGEVKQQSPIVTDVRAEGRSDH